MHCCTPEYLPRLASLLGRYGIELELVETNIPIPGSFWGDSEAGMVKSRVYVRADTPIHSALHEACHVICMDEARRAVLHTDAGGEYAEEDAVCYLQIVLAGELGFPPATICADMDAWGYTFRLGSAQAWFEQDAGEARDWLMQHGLLNVNGTPTFRLRNA